MTAGKAPGPTSGITPPPRFLDRPFDTHGFLRSGVAEHRIGMPLASLLTKLAARLPYERTGADMGATSSREIADVRATRGVYTPMMQAFRSILRTDMEQLCFHYGVGEDPHRLTALRLGSGYSLDWHNHLSSGGAASLLLYLFDEEASDGGEGGELDVGRVGPDMKTISPEVTVKPVHGSLIVIGDGSHPLLKHRAREWRGKGSRYLIAFAFNARDW
jgi:hypothetical protein